MRLFVAIAAPPDAHEAMANAALALHGCMGVKVLPPDNYHLTLKFLGEVPDARLPEIAGALEKLEFAPFPVRLFGAGAFPNVHYPQAIFIGGESAGASGLAAKVDAALLPLGFPPEARKFSVHLTVARAKTVGDIDGFIKKTGEVCSFEARSFSLMKSMLLPQGASYQVLREFPAKPG